MRYGGRKGGSRREAGGGAATRSAPDKGTEVEDRRDAESVGVGHVRSRCESVRTHSGTITPAARADVRGVGIGACGAAPRQERDESGDEGGGGSSELGRREGRE
jgi:hypothetical protein